MRLCVGLLAVTLSSSIAFADEAKAPEAQAEAPPPKTEQTRSKATLRVVRILPESNQALLFDKNRGTHVLAEVGTKVGGYTVESIDDDEVTLSSNGKELVLSAPAGASAAAPRTAATATAAPAPAPAPAPAAVEAAPAPAPAPATVTVAPKAKPAAKPAPAATADPYADATEEEVLEAVDAALEESDPYAEPSPDLSSDDTEVVASTDAENPYDETAAPAPAPKKREPVIATIIDVGSGKPIPVPEAYVPQPPVITPAVLSRTELTYALGDFHKLAGLLRGSFTSQGVRLDVVAEGSIFAKAGLRVGDVVTAVDNRQLRTIDDAADLYARAFATRAANIQVLRAGRPLALRVLIH